MSAVYDDVKKKAVHRQARGFATMHGEPGDFVAGTASEYSSSSLGQYIGSAFITGAAVVYALHGEPNEIGDRPELLPIYGEYLFPVVGQTNTGTITLGDAWVDSEPDVYNSGVVNLQWARKVLYSGKVKIRTAQLPRRRPRTIVGDLLVDEENG